MQDRLRAPRIEIADGVDHHAVVVLAVRDLIVLDRESIAQRGNLGRHEIEGRVQIAVLAALDECIVKLGV